MEQGGPLVGAPAVAAAAATAIAAAAATAAAAAAACSSKALGLVGVEDPGVWLPIPRHNLFSWACSCMQRPKEAAAGSLLLLLLLLLLPLQACCLAVSESSVRPWGLPEPPHWRRNGARALRSSSKRGIFLPSAFLLNAHKPFSCLYTPQQQQGCQQQLLLQKQQERQRPALYPKAFAVLRGLDGAARSSKRSGRASNSSSSSSSVSWHDLLGLPYAPISEGERQQLLLQQAELQREDEAFAVALQEAQSDSGDESALFGQQQPQQQQQQRQQQDDLEALQDALAGVLGLLPNGASEGAAVRKRHEEKVICLFFLPSFLYCAVSVPGRASLSSCSLASLFLGFFLDLSPSLFECFFTDCLCVRLPLAVPPLVAERVRLCLSAFVSPIRSLLALSSCVSSVCVPLPAACLLTFSASCEFCPPCVCLSRAQLAELEALTSRPGSRRSPVGEEDLTSWLEAASALQGPGAQASHEETDAANLFGSNLLEETTEISSNCSCTDGTGSNSSSTSSSRSNNNTSSSIDISSSSISSCRFLILRVCGLGVPLRAAAASRWWMLAAAVPSAFSAFCLSLWSRRAATPFAAGGAAAAAGATAGTAAAAAAAALRCKPWTRWWTSSPPSQAEGKRSSHGGAAALLRQAMQHPAVPSWLLLLQPEQQQQQLKQLQQRLQLQELLQPEDIAFLSRLLSVGTAAAAFLMPKPVSSTSSISSNSSNNSSNSSRSNLSIDWDGQDEAIFSRLLQLKVLLQQQQHKFQGMQEHGLARKPFASIGSAAWARPLVEQYLYLRDQQQQQQQQQQRGGEDRFRGNGFASQGFLRLPRLPPPAAFADRLLLFGHLLSGPSAAEAADGFAGSRSSVAVAGVAAALDIPVSLAETRLKCLLRRIVSSLASRLFASLKPPAFPVSGGSGAEEVLQQQHQKQQQQQQQRKQQLLLGTEALQETAAALGLGQTEVQAACAEALPLLLTRLVASIGKSLPSSFSSAPLSSTGAPEALGGFQHGAPHGFREASTRGLVAALLDVADVAKTFASLLLSPEAAAKTPQQFASLAARSLLPALASGVLAELVADSSRTPLTLMQSPPSFHGRPAGGPSVDPKASGAAAEQEALDAQSACFDVFAAIRRGLQMGQKDFLSVVQIGVFRAGAPLRRAFEGFAIMRNNEALISVARQLLTLDEQLERLVDAACEEVAPQQPQPLVRRRRSRQLQAGGIPVGPPSAGPPDSGRKGPLKKLLMAYLRRHALLGENPSTAAAEALQEAEKAYSEVGGPLNPKDRGPLQAAKGLLEELVSAWDRVETIADCDEQESLPKDATEYAYTLLLQKQQQQQQQQQVNAPDLASRWQQLTSIGTRYKQLNTHSIMLTLDRVKSERKCSFLVCVDLLHRRQEEALKAAQLRAALGEKLEPLLVDLAKHCVSPDQQSDSRKDSTIPSRAAHGPWSRWLLQLRSLQTTEAADALSLQIRDSVLMPLSRRFGLLEDSQAVAAAVEVYRQVFDKETEALSPEANPDTPATADARRRRLLGVRAALGLAASDVSVLHAEAYKAVAVLSVYSLQKEREQLTQEALAIHVVESLLPATLRAAAQRREASVKKSEERAASLPMPIKQVVGEEAVEEEAMGPQPDDPQEPVLRQLKRALARRHEGLKLLRAAAPDLNNHPEDTEKTASDQRAAASNPLSLVEALGAPQQTQGGQSPTQGAPATAANSSPGAKGMVDVSQRLLEALTTLHAFGSGHNLLPKAEGHKRAARELSERQQQQVVHAKQGSHHQAAATLVSALRGSSPAQPLESFVEAFKRQDSPQAYLSALKVALEEALEAALDFAAEAGRGPLAKGDRDGVGLAAALHALQCLRASAAAAAAEGEKEAARSSPSPTAADQQADVVPSRDSVSLATLIKEHGFHLIEIACLEGSRAVASALLPALGLEPSPAGGEGTEAIPAKSASGALAAALQHVQQLVASYDLTDQDALKALSGSREDLIKNLALQLVFRTALKEAARRDALEREAEKRGETPPAFPAWSPSRGLKAAATALGVPAWHRRLRVDSQQLFELFRHEAGATVARALRVAAEGTRGGSRARPTAFSAAADELSTSRSLLDVSGFRATNALKEILKKRLETTRTALTSLLQAGDLPAAVDSLSRVADVVLLSRALMRRPWWTSSSSEFEKMASSVFSNLKQHERRRLLDLCRAKPPTDPASLKEELQLLEELLLPPTHS
ncbi:hypothetical protein Emed_005503 [Eimeria media]